MRAIIKTIVLLALVPAGPALAREAATLKRIDAATVELTRESAAPVAVWISEDASFDETDRLVERDSKAKALKVQMPANSRAYVILRDGQGATTVVGERLVPLAQGSNFRDLGGYPAAGGKHVRWGKIYRSGATPLLTEADLAWVKSLHLADMVDLRSSEERVLAPSRITHVPYTAIGYSMTEMMPADPAKFTPSTAGDLYGELPAFLAPHVKIVFAKLLRGEGPLVYNCSAGQDRTGFVSAMILTALGVPRETILEDYHLSTALRRPEFEMPKIDPAAYPGNPVAKMFSAHRSSVASPLKTADGTAYLAEAFTAIEQRWGSVEAYLDKEAGIDADDIAALRANYLE